MTLSNTQLGGALASSPTLMIGTLSVLALLCIVLAVRAKSTSGRILGWSGTFLFAANTVPWMAMCISG